MWNYIGRTETGKMHRKKDLLCQDRIAYQVSGDKQAISLVDGVGKSDYNILAGERIAQYLTNVTIDKYELLRKHEDIAVKQYIIKDIYRIIDELMKKYKLPKEEFASTLMALAIDNATDSYCAIHLGDGIISCIDNELKILSYPKHGFFKNQTNLTISENVLQEIKILRGQINGKTKFALMSDGVYGDLNFEEDVERVITNEEFALEADDDRGFVCLKK